MYSATIVGYAIGGLAHGTKNVLVRTLVHERAPDRIRGRTFAAYNALRNGAEITALALGGAVVALVGARTALYFAGFGPAVIGLGGLALYARLLPLEHAGPGGEAPVGLTPGPDA
jgi:predicted MFS family arabinose efflux permease